MFNVIVMIVKIEETYNVFCFAEAVILNKLKNNVIHKNVSTIPAGIINIFTNSTFSLLKATQILFRNCIIINHLHKIIFIFRTNIADLIILKSYRVIGQRNINDIINISNKRFMASHKIFG